MPGDQRPEAGDPNPDRLVGHEDAALREQPLDVAQAEREPQIEPNRVLADRLREAKAAVQGRLDAVGLPAGSRLGKLDLRRLARGLKKQMLATGLAHVVE